MAKKINNIGISMKNGGEFTVGVLTDNDLMVERITYERYCYNKGRQGDFSAYVIFYNETSIRRIIPQDQISGINVEVTEEEENDQVEIAPELPE